MIPQDEAYQIALGNINIYTREKFADFDPDTYVVNNFNMLFLLIFVLTRFLIE